MKSEARLAWGVVAASLAYATVRYNVFKGVPWGDWPVYVLNKAIALSSLLLLLGWIVRARRGEDTSQAGLLSLAGRLALSHIVLSLAILRPEYYPSFFAGDKLTWQAGLSLLLGVAAAVVFFANSRRVGPFAGFVTSLGVVAFVVGSHAGLNGYGSWLAPAAWPGYMPPITLLSFLAGTAALAEAGLRARSLTT